MAYPEPIPALKGRHAKEFLERLETLHLTANQKEFFVDAREFYLKLKPRE